MKTRQEMVYDFMLALCTNPELVANKEMPDPDQMAEWTFDTACLMAEQYLNNLPYIENE